MSEEQSGQKKLKQYQIIIIIVAVLIILGVATFFIVRGTQEKEEIPTLQTLDTGETTEVTDAVSVTEFQLGMDDVIATVNGESVTGEDVLTSYQNIVNYYGEPDAENLELYYSVAMEEAITLNLINQTAAEMGLDQFTQEELDELYATSDSEWQYALDNYVSYNLAESEDTTDEERAAAYADAETYYSQMGYSQESLRQDYVDNETFERVQDELCKDVTVTEDEVLAYYNDAVASDQEIYEFDVDAYEYQLLMYQYGGTDQEPWYHPEGYRFVKHILLEVDEDLMATYTDLLARYEEQMNEEEEAALADAAETDTTEADAAADAEATEEPITAEDIDAAKAAIIASVQATIDEINTKLAQGESFDDLIAEYGSDPGMTSGDYPDGYEVSLASYGFVPEFVSAAFSVDAIGDISEPYISEYGVHIVKYIGDVPAGPVTLTDDMKALIEQDLLEEKNNEVLDAWHNDADIQYTGIVRSIEEIQADEMATDDAE